MLQRISAGSTCTEMNAIESSRRIKALTITLLLAACSTAPRVDDTMPYGSWRLVELQSPEDRIGVVRPDDPTKYQLTLSEDGSATLRADCNRGKGRWTSPLPTTRRAQSLSRRWP